MSTGALTCPGWFMRQSVVASVPGSDCPGDNCPATHAGEAAYLTRMVFPATSSEVSRGAELLLAATVKVPPPGPTPAATVSIQSAPSASAQSHDAPVATPTEPTPPPAPKKKLLVEVSP